MTTIGSLTHPNIVRATDAGETDGLHYLVMKTETACSLKIQIVGKARAVFAKTVHVLCDPLIRAR